LKTFADNVRRWLEAGPPAALLFLWNIYFNTILIYPPSLSVCFCMCCPRLLKVILVTYEFPTIRRWRARPRRSMSTSTSPSSDLRPWTIAFWHPKPKDPWVWPLMWVGNHQEYDECLIQSAKETTFNRRPKYRNLFGILFEKFFVEPRSFRFLRKIF